MHVLDVDSEIAAKLLSFLGYIICLRHLFRSRVVTNLFFFSEKNYLPLIFPLSGDSTPIPEYAPDSNAISGVNAALCVTY